MTAARKLPRLPVKLVNWMEAFDRANFELLPLGGGPDGKSPLIDFADRQVTKRDCIRRMAARGSSTYGIRLEGLAVVDLDNSDPDLVSAMLLQFGETPVIVQTGRGFHFWYRSNGGAVPNLRAEGLPVDIKTGRDSYAVGPGSVRPDGVEYIAIKGDLATDRLPFLRSASPSPAAERRDRTPEGERHKALLRAALDLARSATSEEALTAQLQTFRDHRLDRPETVPDAEVQAIAAWAWGLRCANQLWGARNSGFNVNRRALDALKACPGQDQALGLYTRLVAQHGHTGQRFPLDHSAMNSAGLTSMGRPSFLAARRELEQAGLLVCVQKHQAGKHPALWKLALPHG